MPKIKSFDEFLETLDEDTYSAIAQNASKAAEEIRSETDDPKNNLGNQIGVISMLMSRDLLRLYHDWLSEQID